MTPVPTPTAGRGRGRSTSAERGCPRRLFAAVLLGTQLPLLALLALRAIGPADEAGWTAAGPLLTILLPATLLGSAGASWALLRFDRSVRSLRELSQKDELTGSYNRRAGEEHLAEDLARAARDGVPLALAMLDADGLKEANDSFGHAAGDACLKHLAEALRRNVREGDWVARWGGDEFVVALWDAHERSSPEAVLERVAQDLRENPVSLPGGGGHTLTFSAGLSRSEAGDCPTDLLARADALVYEAKRTGRARIAL